jgi:hypothetical protein
MAPKKSTETKVPAKDQAAKKPAASKAASKKDDATDDSDRESNVKSGLHRATKTSVKKETGEEEPAKRGPGRPRNPIAKKEAVDADAEDAAEEAAPKPAAPERGPGRPPNNTTPQTTPAKNGKSKQAPGKTGGWIYTSKEGGTVAERKVARKDENGDNVFPWVSTSTIER